MEPSESGSKPGDGFEARLQSAVKRHSGPVRREKDAVSMSAWGLGGRVGVELLSALTAGVGLGCVLDHWLHTLPLFLILGVVMGGAAGVWNVWRLIGQ